MRSAALARGMGSYRISKRADTDILQIVIYTTEHFGTRQAQRCHAGLERTFQVLARNPGRGRSTPEVGSNLWRCNYESHIVFYRPSTDGVLIVRVLHQAMDAARHQMKDD
jgi:toxin ParE1/3/4